MLICLYTYILIYLYTHILIYLYTYILIYLYTYTLIYLYTSILIHLYTYILIYLYTSILIYLYTYILIYLYTYILIFLYTCIRVYSYTCILVCTYTSIFVCIHTRPLDCCVSQLMVQSPMFGDRLPPFSKWPLRSAFNTGLTQEGHRKTKLNLGRVKIFRGGPLEKDKTVGLDVMCVCIYIYIYICGYSSVAWNPDSGWQPQPSHFVLHRSLSVEELYLFPVNPIIAVRY